MTKIEITIPDKSAPGFLKRQRQALVFQTAFSEAETNPEILTPELLDGLVDFICQYVTKPKTKSAAEKLLWEASENELDTIIGAIGGTGGSTSPKKEGNLETG